MPKQTTPLEGLSRREREIMDIIFRLKAATAREVHESMAEAPSYSSVRSHLSILEKKGHLKHENQGNRYVYLPTVAKQTARNGVLKQVLANFFDGSHKEMLATLIDASAKKLTPEQLDELEEKIRQAREKQQ